MIICFVCEITVLYTKQNHEIGGMLGNEKLIKVSNSEYLYLSLVIFILKFDLAIHRLLHSHLSKRSAALGEVCLHHHGHKGNKTDRMSAYHRFLLGVLDFVDVASF